MQDHEQASSHRAPTSQREVRAAHVVSESGREAGASYDRIWEPWDTQIAEFSSELQPLASALADFRRVSTNVWRIAAWLTGVIAVAFFVMAYNFEISNEGFREDYSEPLLGWGIIAAVLWIVAAIGAVVVKVADESHRDERAEWLNDVSVEAALMTVVDRRTEATQIDTPGVSPQRAFAPRSAMPAPQPYGVSNAGAEALCAAWMRYFGEEDAAETRFTGDGGIDVSSVRYIAQVKNFSGAIGVAAVRELAGVAHVDGRRSLFFTSGTYPTGAVDFANRVGMALFTYDAVEGSLAAENTEGERVFERGL